MAGTAFFRAAGKPKLLFCVAVVLVTLAIITITLRSRRASSPKLELEQPTAPRSESASTTQRTNKSPSQLEVERVTVTTSGFDPPEITRSSGEIVLAIDNRSGINEVRLRLDREGDKRLIDVRVGREKLDWRGRVTLSPGKYRLTEANHPDWLCLFIIME